MKKDYINSENLLLVEGKDEFSFFTALFDFLSISNREIRVVGGCLKFSSYYPTVVNLTGFSNVKRLGFIRDAESNSAKSAFDSISNIIKKTTPNIELPADIGGISKSEIACGIFIMPNNNDSGMLEDLCIKSVEHDSLFLNTEKYIKTAESLLNESDRAIYNTHKAKIQAYLAGKSNIPRNLGEAALQQTWDFSNEAFDEIKEFIKKLFKD